MTEYFNDVAPTKNRISIDSESFVWDKHSSQDFLPQGHESGYNDHLSYFIAFNSEDKTNVSADLRCSSKSSLLDRFYKSCIRLFYKSKDPIFTSIDINFNDLKKLEFDLNAHSSYRSKSPYEIKEAFPFFYKGINIKFSDQLDSIKEIIEESKSILSLEKGWDGEDAEIISHETWEMATSLLSNYASFIYAKYELILASPDINPGRNGSIDLEWRTHNARLLINFNSKSLNKASFYGDRYNNKDSIKGLIETKGVKDYLATWMKDYL